MSAATNQQHDKVDSEGNSLKDHKLSPITRGSTNIGTRNCASKPSGDSQWW